ncbi:MULTISPECIES: EAL domain-containing protein [unclassified Nitratiruptor]|uniref:EAL domain-containing protein n=1 Tax=unclassified Nitratiruptor TaxID=2624044 RepID=UPI00191644F5|nr:MULTISPECIES: EAL domain-containing protein [unclassified Nitratiruptor]BCD60143.1 diguanylate cyclase/phosphodiesterase [Nitratiruptor sp. YY08-10]BCD64368.1 diguanylate cyclase/phosphodiesterase [Nitratiruptor sp. YY08-14]
MIKWIKLSVFAAFLFFVILYLDRFIEYKKISYLNMLNNTLKNLDYYNRLIQDSIKNVLGEHFVNHDHVIEAVKAFEKNLYQICRSDFKEEIDKKGVCRTIRENFAKELDAMESLLQEGALIKSSALYLPTLQSDLISVHANPNLLRKVQEMIEKLNYQIYLDEPMDQQTFFELVHTIETLVKREVTKKIVQNFLQHTTIIYASLHQLHSQQKEFIQRYKRLARNIAELQKEFDGYLVVQERQKIIMEGVLVGAIFLFTMLVYYFITKEQKIERELEYMASHDFVTKLPNRFALFQELHSLQPPFYIVKFNIDNFSYVNDNFGVQAGDDILRLLASIFEKNGCRVFHVSSDEFVVIVEDTDKRLIEAFFKKISNEFIHTSPYAITVSAGAYLVEQKIETLKLNAFLQAALFSAKKRGGDKIVFLNDKDPYIKEYQQFTQQAIVKRQQILHILQEHRLRLVFQPIMEIQSKQNVKYEVLLRVEGNEFKNVSEFIEYAERFNLISEITQYVIDKAFKTLQDFDVALNINLSGIDLMNENLATFIEQKRREYQIDTNKITFEVTETAVVEDTEKGIRFLSKLRSNGYCVAIDDFGTGYTSLRFIKEMPAEYVKIDGSFIKNLHKDANLQEFMKNLVMILKSMEKKVVAEYVENEEIFTILEKIGVDYAQGYYIGKPKSLEYWQKEKQ